MAEGVKVKIRHQVGLHIIDGIREASKELIEIFLVQEHLVAVITPIFKTLLALRDGYEIILSARLTYIKEIGAAFAGLDAFGENAVVVPGLQQCCRSRCLGCRTPQMSLFWVKKFCADAALN